MKKGSFGTLWWVLKMTDADVTMLQLSPLTQTSGSTPNQSPEFHEASSVAASARDAAPDAPPALLYVLLFISVPRRSGAEA